MRFLYDVGKTLYIVLFLVISACTQSDDLAIHGDSTAIGSREGLAKFYNLFPSLDDKRWWNILGKAYKPARRVFNDGVGGQAMRDIREKMVVDYGHRLSATIIYDRRNIDEDAETYIAELSEAIAVLATDHFLIMPQVPRAKCSPETSDQTAAMTTIDTAVVVRWPHHTFEAGEKEAFLMALESCDTRSDGLHRNAKGQAVEAGFIGNWLRIRGW